MNMSTLNPIFQNQKAQKVEVVNELSAKVETSQNDPLVVTPPNSLLANQGTEIRIVDNGSHQNEIYVHPTTNNKNLIINAVQIVNSGVGYFVPYNFCAYNKTDDRISSLLSDIYLQLSAVYTTAEINIFYCTQSSTNVYSFGKYNPI